MSIESIQYALKERFAAPLPEFYQRRIIFWQDEGGNLRPWWMSWICRVWRSSKLTGSNNFEVKSCCSTTTSPAISSFTTDFTTKTQGQLAAGH